jgi:hypothetical protein
MDFGGGVYRFDAESGVLRWDYQFPSYVSWSSPLVVGSAVYVGMDDGTAAAIDVRTGHLVWKTRLRTGPLTAWVPAGNDLVTTSTSSRGALVGFRHNPSGSLLDVPSPTELDLPRALLNFVVAFALVLGLALVAFRLVVRPRHAPEPVGAGGSLVPDADLALGDGNAAGDESDREPDAVSPRQRAD